MSVEPNRPDRVPRPERRQGVVTWERSFGPWRILFLGRGAPARGELVRRGLVAPEVSEAWLRQVHSAKWVNARPGDCGDADALCIIRPGLAGTVATADCVPIVLILAERAMVVHAGWRGIVEGIVEASVAALGGTSGMQPPQAWIGPAIGACCYEVGDEVAAAVAAASEASIVRSASGKVRPHVDLRAAVVHQLARSGVEEVQHLGLCTRCRPEWLWSHRRDGSAAGRNLTVVWRSDAPVG